MVLSSACRSPYAENPADFKPLTAEELAKIKEEKRKKDQVSFFYSPNGTLIGWEQTFRGLYYKTFLWVYLIPCLNKLKCWVWVN